MHEALRRLYTLGPGRMLSGRDRLRRLLHYAGDPQLSVPSILVGGTNGKGRIVAALSAALSTQYRTGAFLKPHLKSIRERWRIGDTDVAENAFIAAAHRTCDLIGGHGEPISFFEANVLLGALLFQEARCEIAIWEVGLGGREDACNLLEPLLSILTNAGYDHQAILGDILADIARDKAHICRPGRTLILGPPRPGWESAYAEYQPAVAAVCRERGAVLEQVAAPPPPAWDAYLANHAQGLAPDTLAVVRAAHKQLGKQDFSVGEAGEAALHDVRYRGRMEHAVLQGHPVLLDAAHNMDSLRWLAHVLAAGEASPRYPVIFGCQATRDPAGLLSELQPTIRELVPIEIPVLKPCPTARIVDAAASLGIHVSLPAAAARRTNTPREHDIGALTELDPPDNSTQWIECVEHGLSLATTEHPTVICGSIYYLGEILRVFE